MKKLNISMLIGIIVLLLSIPFVRGAEVTTIADKDSYVDSDSPTTNYGGKGYLSSGVMNSTRLYEAYLHFSFSDKPDNWNKAEISLYISFFFKKVDFNIILIDQSWGETTITWLNKPNSTNIIKILTLEEYEWRRYKFDISNYIEGYTDISICINITNVIEANESIMIESRESHDFAVPQLIWTTEDIIPGYNILFLIGIIGVISIILVKKRLM